MTHFAGRDVSAATKRLEELLLKVRKEEEDEEDDSTDDENDDDSLPDLITTDDDEDDDFEQHDDLLAEERELSHSWCQAPSHRFAMNARGVAQQSFFGPLPPRAGMAPFSAYGELSNPDAQDARASLSPPVLEEEMDVKEALKRYIQKLQGKQVAPSARVRPTGLISRENVQAAEGDMRLPEPLAPCSPTDVQEELRQEATSSTCQTKDMDVGTKDPVNAMPSKTGICEHCRLPMGMFSYSKDGKRMHAECLAQMLVHEMKDGEEARAEKERKHKNTLREEYSIGWNATSQVPSNSAAVSKLVHCEVPEGMVCLIANGDQTVSLAGTIDPATAVNLEYLSICLQVRSRNGMEPQFSLEPVDPQDRNSMQDKVFAPDWLAGTSVGEVLFQADYHLKELSMGEYEQPVLGMRSCFDHAELEGQDKEWSAREWYVVRNAEVQITQNSVLVPRVNMGIEAREQIVIDDVLEDARITRPDHPMVKYAEVFSKNFDLIAERKSVVFHLRELAKAAVMAKFLLECPELEIEESWLQLASDVEFACSLEVPQIWNQRTHSQIEVKDGKIKDDKDGLARARGIYGGVSFGLSKFPEMGSMLSAATAGISAVRTGVQPGISFVGAAGEAGVPVIDLGFRKAGVLPTGRLPARLLTSMIKAPYTARERVKQKFATPAALSAMASAAAAAAAAAPPPPPPTAEVKRFLFPYKGLSANVATRRAPGLRKTDLKLLAERLGLEPSTTRRYQMVAEAERPVRTVLSRRVLGGGTGYGLGGFRATKAPPSAAVAAAPGVAAPGAARAGPLDTPAASDFTGQGVNLGLDGFDLSKPKRVVIEASAVQSLDACIAMGDAFWSFLDEGATTNNNLQLLRDVFHPKLTDRRSEGDRFIPPDTSFGYMLKLSELVQQEEALRQQRKETFCSETFSADQPGSLFPPSWVSSFEVSKGHMQGQNAAQSALHARPDYVEEAALLQHLLKSAEAIFDKTSEDSVRFRIYRLGVLEVRTVQQPGEEEVIGAVFSYRAPKMATTNSSDEEMKEWDKITKVTEYVEHAYQPAQVAKIQELAPEPDAEPAPIAKAEEPGLYIRYYVVLEMESGCIILTEQLEDGVVTLTENPEDLKDRNSLAKVLRAADCNANVTLWDFKNFQSMLAKRVATRDERKRYSGIAYNRALGNLSPQEVMKAWQAHQQTGVKVPISSESMEQLSTVQRELMAKCLTWN